MRKQKIKVLSAAGFRIKWVPPAEAKEMIDQGLARRLGAHLIQLRDTPPADKKIKRSQGMLAEVDMLFLTSLKPGYVERLTVTKLEEIEKSAPGKIERLQRLAGYKVIPRNEFLENY